MRDLEIRNVMHMCKNMSRMGNSWRGVRRAFKFFRPNGFSETLGS
jgi:hypothetical protein